MSIESTEREITDRQTDRERVKLGIGIEILEYWEKRLNRRQKVFNVVLLINLCSPGRECHSEGTLAVATLRKAKEAPTFVTANKISRLLYTHTVQRVLAKALTQIFPSSFSDRTSLGESLSLSSIPCNIGIKLYVTLISKTSFKKKWRLVATCYKILSTYWVFLKRNRLSSQQILFTFDHVIFKIHRTETWNRF